MKAFATLAALFVGSALFANTAQAGLYNCSTQLKSGQDFKVEVTFNEPTSDKPSIYKSTATIGETSVPQLGAACFSSERPSTRFIKCAHQSGDVRIEIYPVVETTSGALKVMQFIIWNGSRATRGNFSNCRQS